MTEDRTQKRVLALNVHPHSFGFVVFEGPNRILDRGVRSFRGGVNTVKIPVAHKLLALLDESRPSAVVVREPLARKTANILATIKRQARRGKVPVRFVSRRDVNRAFVGFESNKYEVASVLARQFPALAPRLPLKRKSWQNENYQMGVFDAAAIGVAYFTRRRPDRKATMTELS